LRQASALAACLLALLLVAGTFAAGNSQAQSKLGSLDASITRQVQNVLAHDPFLGAMSIRVETQSGVVNLSGFVRSVDDIAKAGELARAVSGVSAVRNGLRVQNRPSRA
jgi:hyperosmotically inducible protein